MRDSASFSSLVTPSHPLWAPPWAQGPGIPFSDLFGEFFKKDVTRCFEASKLPPSGVSSLHICNFFFQVLFSVLNS